MLFWPDPNRLKDPPMTTRAGFVALIGEPNAGKSTLTNRMVGAKVSICLLYTSPSPRDRG